MIEKIGNVELNYKYYAGEDLYTDGRIEDKLLEISKRYDKSEWNKVIVEENSWPILYHFSHIRENITDWLPIKKTDSVLEIGSGCGAITGNLASKAKHVTCVELSKKRSLINAHRNKQHDNIEIIVGNFQDIESDLYEKFDYITLIGVFEYSASYIGTESPYIEMLRIISKHLKPDGKLIIAIENRLGMKYWAGCTEDHVGKYFEGIEGYPTTSDVRTFSKKEINIIFEQTGIYEYEMYYPYPDYKFPLSIYSDERLPQIGELKNIEYNFDRKRIRLFDETRTWDSIIKNDLFPVYSNSFAIIASLKSNEKNEDKCIYTKFSNERSDNFSIRTEVYRKKDGKSYVKKVPVTENGKKHIQNIYRYKSQLDNLYRDLGIEVNNCSINGNEIELEYLNGITMEQILDQYLSEKQYEKIWETLEWYINILKSTGKYNFIKTDKFIKIFGNVELSSELLCPPINNIDVVCENILWENNKWKMLDYEWSFEFPIPVNFQIYRLLNYYLYTNINRHVLTTRGFFEKAGISYAELRVYEQMEANFQQYILGKIVPMRNMYGNISPGILLDINEYVTEHTSNDSQRVQIYLDYGDDFSEDNSIFRDYEQGIFTYSLRITDSIKRLRIDPCSEKCIVKILRLNKKNNENDIIPYISNGMQLGENVYIFDTCDPFFIINNTEKDNYIINIQLQIQFLNKNSNLAKEQFDQMIHDKNLFVKKAEQVQDSLNYTILELQNQIELLKNCLSESHNKLVDISDKLEKRNSLVSEMENTKVWKIYKRYGRIVEKIRRNERRDLS